MTMHVVLGTGQMTAKHLDKELNNLWTQFEEKSKTDTEDVFFFTLVANRPPTKTDTMLVEWLTNNGLYWEVITCEAVSPESIYASAAEVHTYVADDVESAVRAIKTAMGAVPSSDVLALFVDGDDEHNENDQWTNEVCRLLHAGGTTILSLTDGLMRVGYDDTMPEENIKRPARRGEEPEPEPEATPATVAAYTAKELAGYTSKELASLAKGMGVLPEGGTKPVLIEAILKAQESTVRDEAYEHRGEVSDEPGEALEPVDLPTAGKLQELADKAEEGWQDGDFPADERHAIVHAFLHFYHLDRGNASIHIAEPRFSPITFMLARACHRLGETLDDVKEVLAADGTYEWDRGR